MSRADTNTRAAMSTFEDAVSEASFNALRDGVDFRKMLRSLAAHIATIGTFGALIEGTVELTAAGKEKMK